MSEIERLRALLAEGTPGPWEVRDRAEDVGPMIVSPVQANGKRFKVVVTPGMTPRDRAVADLTKIAAAVNALSALLDVAEVARAYRAGDTKAWLSLGAALARLDGAS